MNDITTNQNYLAEPDENGKPRINPTYYKNVLVDYIQRFKEDHNTDKLTNNNMLAICQDIQENVFAQRTNKQYNNNCNIPYSTHNITALFLIYKSVCLKYGCIPSMYGLSILTGIAEDTIKKYVTPAELEILKVRREMLRNALSDDRMGRIVLANNDSSFGLEYEKKNTIERETVKQGLNLTELPKLS